MLQKSFAYAIYGASMILLFLSSTLYHSFSMTRFQKIFRYIDHAAIYLLIAGYVYAVLLDCGSQRPKQSLVHCRLGNRNHRDYPEDLFRRKIQRDFHPILYLGMGWMALFIIQPMYQTLGLNGIVLIGLGGLSYSLGDYFLLEQKIWLYACHLAPLRFGRRRFHVLWHLACTSKKSENAKSGLTPKHWSQPFFTYFTRLNTLNSCS